MKLQNKTSKLHKKNSMIKSLDIVLFLRKTGACDCGAVSALSLVHRCVAGNGPLYYSVPGKSVLAG